MTLCQWLLFFLRPILPTPDLTAPDTFDGVTYTRNDYSPHRTYPDDPTGRRRKIATVVFPLIFPLWWTLTQRPRILRTAEAALLFPNLPGTGGRRWYLFIVLLQYCTFPFPSMTR